MPTIPISEYFDGSPVPAFAIDANHVVTQWNKACEKITGIPASTILGTKDHWRAFYQQERPILVDFIVSGSNQDVIERHYGQKAWRSSLLHDGYEAEAFFPHLGENGRWLFFTAAPLRDTNGQIIGAIDVLQDVTAKKRAEEDVRNMQRQLEQLVAERTAQLLQRNNELLEVNRKLSQAQEQLVQSEKLASIGQLAAGVAHEINNPIGYIFSNIGTLDGYIQRLFEMVQLFEAAEPNIADAEVVASLKAARVRLELDYLKEDIPLLIRESKEGSSRVRKIVQDLKDFSRIDTKQEWQWADIHRGIDSTLNIINNEIKYKADILKEYGDIPEIECLPSKLNQVIMNLVMNAVHAISSEHGIIKINTGVEDDKVWIRVSDTGSGIPEDILPRIFDPFFTTKPIGVGTGLGLSLSYGIIREHRGKLEVLDTASGRGTTFQITLPIRQISNGN